MEGIPTRSRVKWQRSILPSCGVPLYGEEVLMRSLGDMVEQCGFRAVLCRTGLAMDRRKRSHRSILRGNALRLKDMEFSSGRPCRKSGGGHRTAEAPLIEQYAGQGCAFSAPTSFRPPGLPWRFHLQRRHGAHRAAPTAGSCGILPACFSRAGNIRHRGRPSSSAVRRTAVVK